MSLRTFLFFFALAGFTTAAETVQKGVAPGWVQSLDSNPTKKAGRGDGSVRYLLSGIQRHLEEKVVHHSFTTEILTAAGAEDYSQISVDFQPTYQTLVWHTLTVSRSGETQDRLIDAEFEVIRREEGLDRQLYDGELTAHVILKDIRPGDLVSYTYSIRGDNPIFAGRSHHIAQLAYGVAVGLVHRSVIWDPAARTLNWQIRGGDFPLEETETAAGLKTITYTQTNQPKWEIEKNTPGWFDDYPALEVTDYATWKDFGDWANQIYADTGTLPEGFQKICDDIKGRGVNSDEQIVLVLRWVQENIRYLGSFLGEHTHAPYPLEDIDSRRFGDCKDKGTTTVAMLRYLGFDAAPALVHTYDKAEIGKYLPGHRCFNHLIVHLKHNSEDYWLDPTRTFQRGKLKSLYSPDSGYAFVVRESSQKLKPVEPRGIEEISTTITERFDISEMKGSAQLVVETISTGQAADSLRRTFAQNSLEKMEEDYRVFYTRDYPKIEVSAPLEIEDDELANRIVVREHYRIEEIWETYSNDDGSTSQQADFYARYFSDYISTPEVKERKYPYFLSYPVNVTQKIEVQFPEIWTITPQRTSKKLDALDYSFESTAKDGIWTMAYQLQTKADHISAEEFSEFRQIMKNAKDDLYQWVSPPDSASENVAEEVADLSSTTKTYAVLTLATLAGIATGIVIAALIWLWNPPARVAPPDAPIGISGWMVLPAIGCFIYPFFPIIEISSFITNVGPEGINLFGEYEEQPLWLGICTTAVFLEGITLILGILLLVLMLSKRTSFPYAFLGFGIIMLVQTIFIHFLFSLPMNAEDTAEEAGGDAARMVIRLAVWGTYVMVSKRVKATFVVSRKTQPEVANPPPLPTV
ncbi:MAG: DUF3857 domain-containing protein [Akkermansiaceae bacterium]